MKGQPEQRLKAMGVSLEPDLFHSLAWYARSYQMSPKAFLVHLARSYVAAMQKAEQGQPKPE